MSLKFVTASSQRVNLGAGTNLLRNVAAATVSAWINPTSLVSSGSRGIISIAVSTDGSTSRFALEQISGDWQVVARRLDGDSSTLVVGGTPTIGTLVHMVGVARFSTGGLDLYLDGAFVATTANGGWTGNSSNTTSGGGHIGSEDDGLSSYFDGTIDDIRVYNRELSAQEIQAMYIARGRDSNVYLLVDRWAFTEVAGVAASGAGSVKDSGSSRINGTPTNSPTYQSAIATHRHMRRTA